MKFETTACSQCGQTFGPGDEGYSDCRTHQALEGYANQYGYSDVEPFEVVRRISHQTLEVRAMNAERDESVKLEFHVGGFSAHCSNQREQKWYITSDPSAPIIRIRLGRYGWKDKHGHKYSLSKEPRKFYDYNF